MYGPVRTVVWQGSAGDRRPYADQTPFYSLNLFGILGNAAQEKAKQSLAWREIVVHRDCLLAPGREIGVVVTSQ